MVVPVQLQVLLGEEEEEELRRHQGAVAVAVWIHSGQAAGLEPTMHCLQDHWLGLGQTARVGVHSRGQGRPWLIRMRLPSQFPDRECVVANIKMRKIVNQRRNWVPVAIADIGVPLYHHTYLAFKKTECNLDALQAMMDIGEFLDSE